jgi:heptosyltransferase-2
MKYDKKIDKPVLITYLNNSIAFVIYSLLKKNLPTGQTGGKTLFINTGQIGDLTISTVLLKNILDDPRFEEEIYFLIKNNYIEIFKYFPPQLKIIEWNYSKYKFNLIYRIRFLISIRRIGFRNCFNLTAGRGVTVDELALLSGAQCIYALNSNFRYLKNLYGIFLNKQYTDILSADSMNEYEKHFTVLEKLGIPINTRKTSLYINDTEMLNARCRLASLGVEKYLVISPFSDLTIKNWSVDKFNKLISEILIRYSTITIILIGSIWQYEKISKSIPFNPKLINLAGSLSIIESIALLKEAILFIGNDSGFTHISKALEIPTIAIIGGGSYGNFFPYGTNENISYFYAVKECFKCEWRCIHNFAHCLDDVQVEDVLITANKIIESNITPV